MSSLKYPRAGVVDTPRSAHQASRRLAARLLRKASAVLARLSRRLAEPAPLGRPAPHLEFHTEVGAPEGALYIDGQLVGWLTGVKRL